MDIDGFKIVYTYIHIYYSTKWEVEMIWEVRKKK